MNLDSYLNNARIHVRSETFAIVKAKEAHPKAFVNIADDHEVTVIIDQGLVNDEQVIEMERDWRVMTLDIVLPMALVGVTATIATALANAGVPIMPIAAYSRDHFLVRNSDLPKALSALEKIGIQSAAS